MADRTFDPVVELGKLSDQLCAHDKPLAFLIGAGASAAVRDEDDECLIPAVKALTTQCHEAVSALGGDFDKAWDAIWTHLVPADQQIEGVLSAVRLMQSAAMPGDSLAGLSTDQLDRVAETIQGTISKAVQPDKSRVPESVPHDKLAQWIKRITRSSAVEIFTTNYDTLLEASLEKAGVPVFDGFIGALEPTFEPSSLSRQSMSPGRDWTRLWKIHGSVTWKLVDIGGAKRVLRTTPLETGEMILPSSQKYDESRKQPYLAMLDRLGRCLTSQQDAILIATGFGFGDQHINEIIFEALDENPRVHVFALMFDDPKPEDTIYKLAMAHTNLVVLARTIAIVGSQAGTWRSPGSTTAGPPLTTDLFETEESGQAELKIGDFNVLCELLESIGNRP